MELIYAVGASIIEDFQTRFSCMDSYFNLVNNLSNPQYMLEYVFPVLSIIDSVFAAQLVLSMAFGGWLNAVSKWWLLEDRPYWWVRETDYYQGPRPVIRQTDQTCETGPGSPSGHTQSMACFCMLTILWISHILNDRRWKLPYWKGVWWSLCACAVGSTMLARVYTGAHFPHQVLLGALLGLFLGPLLCIYVVDPFVWQHGAHQGAVGRTVFWHTVSALTALAISFVTYFAIVVCFMFTRVFTFKYLFLKLYFEIRLFLGPLLCIYVVDPFVWQYGAHQGAVGRTVFWHTVSALTALAISFVTYFAIVVCGFDPFWTIKLAFRHCASPNNVHVSTTPVYALAHSLGTLLGWALSVTPAIAKYRHNTRERSLIISAFATYIVVSFIKCLQEHINKDNAKLFYTYMFLTNAIKVPLLLCGVPFLAMWPYNEKYKRYFKRD